MAVLAAASALVAPASAPRCDVPDHWPHTRDAAWLWQSLRKAGWTDIGCTGSAFVISIPGPRSGGDAYLWAVGARRVPRPFWEPASRWFGVAGVRVHGTRVRASWRACRRIEWIQSGPTSGQLPPIRRLG